ncbi:tRNA (N(6)-L-threonylcarbamoyladenosine(37)-C(2))-methylthiotransferase [Candidatus Micrarchaeota archaeon]|nr:tRNA (N(6)-L-threonylcarbamoyladenosine(37)-C(2))-methylthiotransferase [Candidatus Micrarchaeota archaeon]
MRIFIKTFGCTFNKADSDGIEVALEQRGHSLTRNETKADFIILNTCTVKEATQNKILRKISETDGTKLLVTGCLAQASPELIEKANPYASIIGIFLQSRIADAVEEIKKGNKLVWNSGKTASPLLPNVDGVISRIKIARGCLGNCSFCETKFAQGSLESYSPKEILHSAETAVENGAREIQLCAQDTGCYGFDRGVDLAELLNSLVKIEGNFFIRVGMMNPDHATKLLPRLLCSFSSPKIYKFIHFPVQSGSDSVLKAMERPHFVSDFIRVVSSFREQFPEITIATDVIVGFPGESEADFKKTLELIALVKPDVVNVSKFSARPHARASQMKGLERSEIKRRSGIASALCRRIALEKNKESVGKKCVLLINEKARGWMQGRNLNYKPVLVKKGNLGEFLEARVIQAGPSHLKAEVLEGALRDIYNNSFKLKS